MKKILILLLAVVLFSCEEIDNVKTREVVRKSTTIEMEYILWLNIEEEGSVVMYETDSLFYLGVKEGDFVHVDGVNISRFSYD